MGLDNQAKVTSSILVRGFLFFFFFFWILRSVETRLQRGDTRLQFSACATDILIKSETDLFFCCHDITAECLVFVLWTLRVAVGSRLWETKCVEGNKAIQNWGLNLGFVFAWFVFTWFVFTFGPIHLRSSIRPWFETKGDVPLPSLLSPLSLIQRDQSANVHH